MRSRRSNYVKQDLASFSSFTSAEFHRLFQKVARQWLHPHSIQRMQPTMKPISEFVVMCYQRIEIWILFSQYSLSLFHRTIQLGACLLRTHIRMGLYPV